jgi:hypothetical protein
VFELFEGASRVSLERESNAFDDESCCVGRLGGGE